MMVRVHRHPPLKHHGVVGGPTCVYQSVFTIWMIIMHVWKKQVCKCFCFSPTYVSTILLYRTIFTDENNFSINLDISRVLSASVLTGIMMTFLNSFFTAFILVTSWEHNEQHGANQPLSTNLWSVSDVTIESSSGFLCLSKYTFVLLGEKWLVLTEVTCILINAESVSLFVQ